MNVEPNERVVAEQAEIPVVDAAGLPHDPATLAEVDRALRQWGCFYLAGWAGAGQPALVADLLREMRSFFALPAAAKRAVERTAENAWGYYDRELTKNVVDWKQIYDVGPADGGHRPRWPSALPGFRGAVERYYAACEGLAHRVLAAISVCLGMPAGHLRRDFDGHTSFLRMNYYPPCPSAARADAPTGSTDGRFGINHHTDAGAITLLLQDDRPGLQVWHEGAWVWVPPLPDTLTVNVGDIVQVWSNDRYPAALHRVIADPERERFSVPFFFNPAYRASYAPLPGACRDQPARYRPINWGEFRARRAAGDYADLGAEVQIADYRI